MIVTLLFTRDQHLHGLNFQAAEGSVTHALFEKSLHIAYMRLTCS